MAYTAKLWSERVRSRIDIAGQIIHLPRSATINGTKISALQRVLKILRERRLLGSTSASGFIVGGTRAVCFQDAPLYSVCQNIDFERLLVREKQSNRVRSGEGGRV
jgi:hypothetical protein